jgi:hypothetical protein
MLRERGRPAPPAPGVNREVGGEGAPGRPHAEVRRAAPGAEEGRLVRAFWDPGCGPATHTPARRPPSRPLAAPASPRLRPTFVGVRRRDRVRVRGRGIGAGMAARLSAGFESRFRCRGHTEAPRGRKPNCLGFARGTGAPWGGTLPGSDGARGGWPAGWYRPSNMRQAHEAR